MTRYTQRIFRRCTAFCWGCAAARPWRRELCQEAFVQAMIHWRDFRGDCAVETWLCAIAKRLYFSRCRRENTRPLPQDSRDAQSGPEELLLSREGEARLHRLLHTLPEPYREIFTLRVFAELDFRQLGELFHKSDTWARVTFYRAKVKLQEAIRRDEHEQV